MSNLGIYFGPNITNVSETEGKKLINNLQISISGASESELDEKVPVEIKMVAAFNDAFRRNKVNAKEATLCFSGEDVIIRTFELPVLPKEEIDGAITFEAKKYMPFKLEDLISCYQLEFNRLSRTNTILFIGIKKVAYNKYLSILNQLNIKVVAIEYAGFSILRAIKLSGVKDKGVIGVLCLDSQGQDEINFTVLEEGFPLFSRNVSLNNLAEESDLTGESASSLFMTKLKSEINLSLEYYHRKFSAKPLKNIFLISNPDLRKDLELFMTEVGLSSRFVDIAKIIGKPISYSGSLVKSYGASVSKVVTTRLRLNLVESKQVPTAKAATTEGSDLGSLLKKIELDFRLIISGILICVATFFYGIFQTRPLEQKLGYTISNRVKVDKINPDDDYEALNAVRLKYRKSMVNLDNLIKKQLYVTEILNIVSHSLPQGVWLNKFFFNNRENDKVSLVLEGLSRLKDSSEEFQAVNKFFSNLNSNPDFTKYFSDITIDSIDHTQLSTSAVTVTTFVISCNTTKARK